MRGAPALHLVRKGFAVHDIHAYLQALSPQTHADGGWGYTLGQAAHLEPTALALLALARDPERYGPSIAQGKQFLERCARPDGTYRLARGRQEAVWPTALVLFVQTVLDYPPATVEQTVSALLTIRGLPAPLDKESEIH